MSERAKSETGEPVESPHPPRQLRKGSVFGRGAVPKDAPKASGESPRSRIDAQHEREVLALIDERDAMHDWADRLAYAIAPQSVIGEHSSANNPWANALEVRENERPVAERLAAALRDLLDSNESDYYESADAARATLAEFAKARAHSTDGD